MMMRISSRLTFVGDSKTLKISNYMINSTHLLHINEMMDPAEGSYMAPNSGGHCNWYVSKNVYV
jgi:hypothetical protein